MKNFKKISLATIGTLTIIGTSSFAVTGIVNAPSGLVLRKEASKVSEPITTVVDDSKVDVLEEDGEWYKVSYNNQEGYLFAKYVDVEKNQDIPTAESTQTSAEPTDGATISKNKLSVYAIPLITSTVINEIEPEVPITVEKQITNWSYITAGEISGWVRTYGIEGTVQTNTEPVNNKVQENTVPQEKEVPEDITPQENIKKPEVQENKTEEPAKQEPENKVQPSNNAQNETQVEQTKGFVSVEYANIRKEASTNAEIVTTLTKDTSFTINAETEEWYKIKYTSPDGVVYEGYIYKNLATK